LQTKINTDISYPIYTSSHAEVTGEERGYWLARAQGNETEENGNFRGFTFLFRILSILFPFQSVCIFPSVAMETE
jgi:hypothetical protein